MGIHSAFLGSSGTSTITAQSTSVSAGSFNSSNAGFQFTSSGAQLNIRNGSQTIVGNWVTPPSSADQWEIRAILTSGDAPIGASLNTWIPLTTTRTWELFGNSPGIILSAVMTFEFRRVGGSTPEVTVTGNTISVEVLDGFR